MASELDRTWQFTLGVYSNRWDYGARAAGDGGGVNVMLGAASYAVAGLVAIPTSTRRLPPSGEGGIPRSRRLGWGDCCDCCVLGLLSLRT